MPLGIPLNIQNKKTENNLVFGETDLGLVGIRLCSRVEKQRLSKDGRAIFLGIYAYQRGRGL